MQTFVALCFLLPNASRRKGNIKLRAEINEFLWKILFENTLGENKLDDNFLTRKIKKYLINWIRNERECVTTDTTEIPTIIRDYFENLNVTNWENPKWVNILLNYYNLPS